MRIADGDKKVLCFMDNETKALKFIDPSFIEQTYPNKINLKFVDLNRHNLQLPLKPDDDHKVIAFEESSIKTNVEYNIDESPNDLCGLTFFVFVIENKPHVNLRSVAYCPDKQNISLIDIQVRKHYQTVDEYKNMIESIEITIYKYNNIDSINTEMMRIGNLKRDVVITLSKEDNDIIRFSRRYNDSIMSYYLKNTLLKAVVARVAAEDDLYIFDSTLVNQLSNNCNRMGADIINDPLDLTNIEQTLKTLERRGIIQINGAPRSVLFDKEFFLFVVNNVRESHWVLYIIHDPFSIYGDTSDKPILYVFDSLFRDDRVMESQREFHKKMLILIRMFLERHYKVYNTTSPSYDPNFKINPNRATVYVKVPVQTKGLTCGSRVLYYIKQFLFAYPNNKERKRVINDMRIQTGLRPYSERPFYFQ